jgi:NTP pyrophosphatase (non-canonical NTP hydrolase)
VSYVHCLRDDHELYREVLTARRHAHEKHGDNSIEAHGPNAPAWLPILGEEFGELCAELTYDKNTGDLTRLRAELIDVLAVASAWVDAIDRSKK